MIEQREWLGRSWAWPAEDTGAWHYLRRDWPSHQAKIRQHCQQFDVALIAGGCAGLYPRLLADMFKHVYTFEPDSLNFQCLVRNCEDKNVYPMRAALGKETGFVKVRRPYATNCGMNEVVPAQRVAVPRLTIDQICLPVCDLIMLDVEGQELDCIKGAGATLKRCQPVLFLEKGNYFAKKVRGYKWVDTSWMDCIFIRDMGETTWVRRNVCM